MAGAEMSPVRRARDEWRAAWSRLPDTPNLPPRAAALAQRQGFVLTREQTRLADVSDARLRSELRSGRWSTPRRGVVCPLPRGSSTPGPSGTSAQVLAAAAALARGESVISHASAAQLECLPLLVVPRRPILTATYPRGAGGRANVLVRGLPFGPNDLASWYGAPVTSIARTIVDLARTDGVAAGLVAADAALAEVLVEPEQLAAALRAAFGRPGVQFARRVVELADGRSESPLESLTRLCLIDGGITPEPQQWLRTDRGWFRVDLLVDSCVVVEADGLLKYRTRDDEVNPLVLEKLRQEALVRAGYEVVRVTWSDVRTQPAETVSRVRAALVRAR